jgi:hypothetical protein
VSDGFESIVTREVHAKNGPVDFVSHACSDHNKRRVEAEDSNSDEEEGDSSSEEEEVIEEDLHHIVVVVERVKDEWEDKEEVDLWCTIKSNLASTNDGFAFETRCDTGSNVDSDMYAPIAWKDL